MVQNAEVRLRGYRAGDLDAMYRLDLACFEPVFRFSRGEMRRFAETKKARVVLAEIGGEIAGFCIVHVERGRLGNGRVGYVVTLDVAETYRRRGVARLLMNEVERVCGCAEMRLHVFVGNAKAVRFYESMGYEKVGVDAGFYSRGVDADVYQKPLQA